MEHPSFVPREAQIVTQHVDEPPVRAHVQRPRRTVEGEAKTMLLRKTNI